MNDASRTPLRRLSFLYVGAYVGLVAVTWPLWMGNDDFPKIPAFAGLVSVPEEVDRIFFVAMQIAALASLAVTRRVRLFWIVEACFVLGSFALNQHRLQVWAWHLCLAGVISAFSSTESAVRRLRWLTISIYAWSAISKLDAGFATGPGRTLLHGLSQALHVHPGPGVERFAPWIMPAGELVTAIALAIPAARRIGLALSIAMHLLLLLAVGPFGLGHELGVQVWNVLFLVQNVLLFVRGQKTELPMATAAVSRRTDLVVGALLGVAIVMPAAQPWGYWDVWPSWAVYSTRGGWTTSFVHHNDVARLPESVQRFLGQAPPLSDWRPIDIDAWSLNQLHCPVYPQSRFRLAVAAWLSRDVTIRVERRSPPDRRTGSTEATTIEVTDGMLPTTAAQEFWFNAAPRR